MWEEIEKILLVNKNMYKKMVVSHCYGGIRRMNDGV